MIYAQTDRFSRLISTWLDRIWPPVCCICAQSGVKGLDLCQSCRSHFPYMAIEAMPQSASARFMTLCLACGTALAAGCSICSQCANNSSPYAQLVVPFRYAYPIDKMIVGLKYGQKLSFGRVLGGLLADEIIRTAASLPDALVPMPMHPTRFRQRGFNQSVELATSCARRLKLPLQHNWAYRRVDTPALAGLTKASRELEIRGAFKASDEVKGKHIAIVDDVLTTGASSSELARELYDSGAQRVSLWVVARTAAGGSRADLINLQLGDP